MELFRLLRLISIGFLSCLPAGCSQPWLGSAEPEAASFPSFRSAISLDGGAELARLLAEEDTDGDLRITVSDPRLGDGRGDRRFEVVTIAGDRFEVVGTYELSNLLQEISLGLEAGERPVSVDPDRIWEAPTQRIGRSIRELYWDGLTRRIDDRNLAGILSDEKLDGEDVRAARRFLFVPHDDRDALEYFCEVARARPELQVQVERLPPEIDPAWVRSLDRRWNEARVVTEDPCVPAIDSVRVAARHGLLVLALSTDDAGRTVGAPFVVPGGRFNEMYGWDSYFEALGLLADGRIALARSMVDNFVYQIEHYGKILNANRTYYLTRSQPPFLTSMISAVYRRLPHGDTRRAWLRRSLLAAIAEYEEVWAGPNRLTTTGLSRYHGVGLGAPPEVEPGHFDAVFSSRAASRGLASAEYEERYRAGLVVDPELDRYFEHDRCMRESGHDTTYRWDVDGNRCGDFVTVDLNSLLHKVEVDIARMIRDELGDRLMRGDGRVETSAAWYGRAARRRDLIQDYLWEEGRSMFFDYDFVRRRRRAYVSATALYPLWAWNPDDPVSRLLSDEQARRLVEAVIPMLETAGGVVASSLESRGPLSETRRLRQWDYPHGWAPHQMLVWRGLRNHGFDEVADRLTYKWLYTITLNAVRYNGTVPEKFDVVRRSHRVFAEYGNVGTNFDYITREGFGWMNASYQVGLATLSPSLRSKLDRLVAPESIDFSSD